MSGSLLLLYHGTYYLTTYKYFKIINQVMTKELMNSGCLLSYCPFLAYSGARFYTEHKLWDFGLSNDKKTNEFRPSALPTIICLIDLVITYACCLPYFFCFSDISLRLACGSLLISFFLSSKCSLVLGL